MNRLKLSICLLLFSILVSSCQVFPYVYETPSVTNNEIAALTEAPQPTQTLSPQTASPEESQTVDFTAIPEEPTLEPTSEPNRMFIVQEGNPAYMANFANPDLGCEWMGVAGQVFDENGSEMIDLVIAAGSTLDPDGDEISSQTGTALSYGPGGYEIQLMDAPQDTSQTFWIEVRNQDGTVYSERVFFDTTADCGQNLILINFIQDPDSSKTMPTTPEVTPTLEAYP